MTRVSSFYVTSGLIIVILQWITHAKCRRFKACSGAPEWQPETGTRKAWMRYHGYSAEKWNRTVTKVNLLKMMIAKEHNVPIEVIGNGEDGLDSCLWMTEEQIDELLENQREKRTLPNEVRQRQRRNLKYFKKWTTLPIKWKIDGTRSASHMYTIRAAFQHWMDNTCVRFKEIPTDQPEKEHHLLVTDDKKTMYCYSYIGEIDMIPQVMNLGLYCTSFGTSVHEMGHALGLWHEHQRADRDDYVTVHWANVVNVKDVGQYYKKHDAANMIVEYDIGSVMHYPPQSALGAVITTVDPLYQGNMGQQLGMSYNDAKSINFAYCNETCSHRPLSSPCKRGGYQDPNNCDKCRCPEGFGGDRCEKVAESINAKCSETIILNSTVTYKSIKSPGYDDDGYYVHSQSCNWLIQADRDQRITAEFRGIFGLYIHAGRVCYHWVEVRYGDDLGKQGPRLCGYRRPASVLSSTTNEMLIMLRSNWSVPWKSTTMGFHIVVRIGNTAVQDNLQSKFWYCSFEEANGDETWCQMEHGMKHNRYPSEWAMASSAGRSRAGPGPSKAYNGNHFITINTNDTRRSDASALIWLPEFRMRGEFCLSFQYHMDGNDVTSLQLLMQNSLYRDAGTIWIRREHSKKWQTCMENINLYTNEITKFALRGYVRGVGSVAVDDIIVTFGMCEQRSNTMQLTTTTATTRVAIGTSTATTTPTTTIAPTSTTAPSATSIHKMSTSSGIDVWSWKCTFENDYKRKTWCDLKTWRNDWAIISGAASSDGIGPNAAYNPPFYIHIDVRTPRSRYRKVMIFLPQFRHCDVCCVRFRYQMYGRLKMDLSLVRSDGNEPQEVLWQRNNATPNVWHLSTLETRLDDHHKLVFVNIGIPTGIALDDLRVHSGPCDPKTTEITSPITTTARTMAITTPATSQPAATSPTTPEDNIDKTTALRAPRSVLWQCSFEGENGQQKWCGVHNIKNDDFDWTMNSGETPSQDTGPEAAYSRPNYIYIEASQPRNAGDKAIIFLPSIQNIGKLCMSFRYHMYGDHINELRLVQYSERERGGPSTVWFRKKEQTPHVWHEANQTVDMSINDRLAFVGIRGDAYSGDIALDNIVVTSKQCA